MKFVLGSLNLGASAASKNMVLGACPRKFFRNHGLWIVGERTIFGKFAIEGSKG